MIDVAFVSHAFASKQKKQMKFMASPLSSLIRGIWINGLYISGLALGQREERKYQTN